MKIGTLFSGCHDLSLLRGLVGSWLTPDRYQQGGALGYKVVGRAHMHDSIIINTINLPSCSCALPVEINSRELHTSSMESVMPCETLRISFVVLYGVEFVVSEMPRKKSRGIEEFAIFSGPVQSTAFQIDRALGVPNDPRLQRGAACDWALIRERTENPCKQPFSGTAHRPNYSRTARCQI